MALRNWGSWDAAVEARVRQRAATLAEAHRRVRQTAGAQDSLLIEPVLPPDLVGILVLQPVLA
jgi:hypothetical protein